MALVKKKKKKKKLNGGEPVSSAARPNGLGKAGDKAHEHRDIKVLETSEKELPVKVAPEIVNQMSLELSKLVDAQETLDGERAEVMRNFRERQSSIKDQMKRLNKSVKNSTKLQLVACATRLLPTGIVEVVRLDDQTLVEDAHVASDEERQESLPGVDRRPKDGNRDESDDADDDDAATVKGPPSKAAKGR